MAESIHLAVCHGMHTTLWVWLLSSSAITLAIPSTTCSSSVDGCDRSPGQHTCSKVAEEVHDHISIFTATLCKTGHCKPKVPASVLPAFLIETQGYSMDVVVLIRCDADQSVLDAEGRALDRSMYLALLWQLHTNWGG